MAGFLDIKQVEEETAKDIGDYIEIGINKVFWSYSPKEIILLLCICICCLGIINNCLSRCKPQVDVKIKKKKE